MAIDFPAPYGTITAAPSIASSLTAISASFTFSSGNDVTFGFNLISAASCRKSRAGAGHMKIGPANAACQHFQ
jgi:hypothetical protein